MHLSIISSVFKVVNYSGIDISAVESADANGASDVVDTFSAKKKEVCCFKCCEYEMEVFLNLLTKILICIKLSEKN